MSSCQLSLTAAQFQLLLDRKTAIESKFAVSINTPGAKNLCNHVIFPLGEFSDWTEAVQDRGIYMTSITGEQENVVLSKKYIMEALVLPEIIEIHSYHRDLKQIFCSKFWTEIIERIHSVCISDGTDYEVNISGTESSVTSAVSYLQKLTDIYCTNLQCPSVNTLLVCELSKVLKTFKREDLESSFFSRYPECVKELLLSWLKEAYREHFHQCSCTEKLNGSIENFADPCSSQNVNDSVEILNGSISKAEDSVIIIDSDSDEKKNMQVVCQQKFTKKQLLKLKKKHLKKYKGTKAMKKFQNNLQKKAMAIAGVIGEVTQSSTATANSQLRKVEAPKSFSLAELPDFIPLCSDMTEERPSSHVKPNLKKKRKRNARDLAKLPDFVPLHPGGREISLHASQSVIAPSIPEKPRRLRPVVIDGSNVAMAHGGGKIFSCRGIALTIEYFQNRGHTNITAFVPQSRRHHYYNGIADREILEVLAERQQLVFTPSRKGADGVRITCYDDRFIIDLAARIGGVVVSNDGYLDLIAENPDWKKVIEERVLMFCFAGDIVMFPDDPLGVKGPRLKDFLSLPDE